MSRQGLTHHSNYPSARMTLGRALLDSGDLASARREFEAVLKGAADNILASRYLAECLEGLGQSAEALAQYKATLALAPGDKQVQARIQALEKAASAPPSAAPRAADTKAPRPAAAEPSRPGEDTDPAPIRLVDVDGPMELVTRYEEAIPGPAQAPAAPAEDIYIAEPAAQPPPEVAPEVAEAPVKLRPMAEEEFELDRAYDAMPAMVPSAADAVPVATASDEDDDPILEADSDEDVAAAPQPFVTEVPAPQAATPEPVVPAPPPEAPPEPEPALLQPDVIDEEFDVETPVAGPPRVTFRDIIEETPAARGAATPAAAQPAAMPQTPAAEPELSSPTLAELYFDQGFPDKAIEVYRRLLQREPDNERLRDRMREIEAIRGRGAVGAGGPPGNRQEAIGRAIARLQDLRAALARRD